ncbi:MAG: ribosome maturation factor RimP [Thermonemataceae bacterium]|nr:ribosome maturation factor RimP [Thermonemataceae bacterium]
MSSILEPAFFLVEIQIKQLKEKKKIMVFLDGDSGVNIDVCVKINRALGAFLEEKDFIDTAYDLEVSSPGVDNPLKLWRQYPQHIGRTLMITLQDDSQIEGKLLEAENQKIKIEQKKGKAKKAEITEQEFDFTSVKTAKVLISFK